MATRGLAAPSFYQPARYWEARAQRFAAEGAGLAAVCSYGMPAFYNWTIDLGQRMALAPWISVRPGMRILDIGCGVGRWSRRLAERGAQVTGIDLSPTMIAQAQHRTERAGLSGRCSFEVQDIAHLAAEGKFDLVLGVTVLQHILDTDALRSAVHRMASHLAPGGRMVLLEAAPVRPATSCDTSVFRARERSEYLRLFEECGLRVRAIGGVDPAPLKIWLLPHLSRMPRSLAVATLAVATGLAAPFDLLLGRAAAKRSWHAVFVLEPVHGESQ
jgi:SAM-dependent methyltransferase